MKTIPVIVSITERAYWYGHWLPCWIQRLLDHLCSVYYRKTVRKKLYCFVTLFSPKEYSYTKFSLFQLVVGFVYSQRLHYIDLHNILFTVKDYTIQIYITQFTVEVYITWDLSNIVYCPRLHVMDLCSILFTVKDYTSHFT